MVQQIEWESYVSVPPETSPDAIAALEASLGVRLPEDYKQILARHAGETTMPDTMPVGQNSSTPFGPLLHTAADAGKAMAYSIAVARERLREWGGAAAEGLVPVASNTATGYFCFDYRTAPDSPPLVFVDMNYQPDEAGAILPVAPSFSAALDRLTID